MEMRSGLKGAIIGFGNIASLGHLPALRELGIQVVAAVDVCESRRRRAEQAGVKALASLEELEGMDIDFIDICTPPSYRREPITFAIEHGLDIICEKPLSKPGELDEIRDLVLKSKVFLYPVHNWKHAPQYRKVKEMVEENGGVRELQMSTLRTTYSTGNPDWNPAWRVDKSISGGGIIMDHGYHNIYLAMHLFGSEYRSAELEEIACFRSNPSIERRAVFSLAFPDGGRARISLDWSAGRREIRNVIHEPGSVLELRDRAIIGSNQVYVFQESLSKDSVHGRWYGEVFKDFLARRERRDLSQFHEASKVLEGIEELYRQAWEGSLIRAA